MALLCYGHFNLQEFNNLKKIQLMKIRIFLIFTARLSSIKNENTPKNYFDFLGYSRKGIVGAAGKLPFNQCG
jgi:hypothetical protein